MKCARRLGGLLLGCALAVTSSAAEPDSAAAALPGGFAPNHRAIVEQAVAAVVGVEVSGMRIPGPQQWLPDEVMPLLPFNGPLPFRGQGSGFIVTSDGLVLTSAHVIRGATRVTVRLADRRQFRAHVLGSDLITDVAVLRVQARGLPVLRMGQADRLRVGDPVVAIGAPFGLGQSVSHGIVSAPRRALPGLAVPHIQSDAPLHPGNSGGPLLDASASVVGINSHIYTAAGGYMGLSFAVPIDVALHVKEQILTHGRMPHAYLGVTMQNLDLTLATVFGLDRPRGALVADVDVDSSAEAAGLRAGDVITGFDGAQVDDASELISHMGLASPGQRVRLEVWRARRSRDIVVRLDDAEEVDGATAPDTEPAGPGSREPGWQLRALSGQERNRLGVPSGLWVERAGALGAQAGLREGDALLSINLTPVYSVDDVRRLTRQRPQQLGLLVDRDGVRLFIPLELD